MTYEINQYVFGAWRTVTLLIRRLNGRINLWAESADDATQPRGLCEDHEALVFDPDLNGLEIGNQSVIGLVLPSETFAKIQADILDIQSDDLAPRHSPARLHGGVDESHGNESPNPTQKHSNTD